MARLMRLLCFTAVIGPAASVGNVYAFHIVLVAALCSIAPVELFAANRSVRSLPSRYHHLFPFMIGWFALGLIWSWDRHYTLLYLVYLFVGSALSMLVVVYVKTDLRKFETLLHATGVALLADIVIGLLETFTEMRLPISPYSASNAAYNLDSLSLDAIERLSACPTGFQWNPNHYAVGISLVVPFVLLHQRAWLKIGGLITLSVLIFSSGSRACMVALVVALVAFPIFHRARSGRLVLPIACIGTICFLFAGSGSLGYLAAPNERFGEALGTVEAIKRLISGEGTGDSIDIRRNLVLNGLTALKQTYGLGVGGGADAYVHQRFGGVRDIHATHNIWVELLVNGGVILFVPFAIWYWSLARELRRWHLRSASNRKLSYYCSALSLGLITFLFSAISASTVIYFLPMFLFFGLAISMLNICRNAARQKRPSPALAFRPQVTRKAALAVR
jgi:hypothetical protein